MFHQSKQLRRKLHEQRDSDRQRLHVEHRHRNADRGQNFPFDRCIYAAANRLKIFIVRLKRSGPKATQGQQVSVLPLPRSPSISTTLDGRIKSSRTIVSDRQSGMVPWRRTGPGTARCQTLRCCVFDRNRTFGAALPGGDSSATWHLTKSEGELVRMARRLRAESSNVFFVPDVRADQGRPGHALLAQFVKLRWIADQAHAWIPTVEEHHSFALKCVSNFAARRCRRNVGPTPSCESSHE